MLSKELRKKKTWCSPQWYATLKNERKGAVQVEYKGETQVSIVSVELCMWRDNKYCVSFLFAEDENWPYSYATAPNMLEKKSQFFSELSQSCQWTNGPRPSHKGAYSQSSFVVESSKSQFGWMQRVWINLQSTSVQDPAKAAFSDRIRKLPKNSWVTRTKKKGEKQKKTQICWEVDQETKVRRSLPKSSPGKRSRVRERGRNESSVVTSVGKFFFSQSEKPREDINESGLEKSWGEKTSRGK